MVLREWGGALRCCGVDCASTGTNQFQMGIGEATERLHDVGEEVRQRHYPLPIPDLSILSTADPDHE
jgi:hypothetical protein